MNHYKTLFLKIKPSFFEWTTALAFSYFKDTQIRYKYYRNWIRRKIRFYKYYNPEIAIITSIGL